MKKSFLFFVIVFVIGISGCLSPSDDDFDTSTFTGRAYYMGFTPFPYDITLQAVQETYQKISVAADIINHHFDAGIPWQEALENSDLPEAVMDDWQGRLDQTPANHKVIISTTPVNLERNGLAPYWGESESMPLPEPWDAFTYNDDGVKTAYANYCKKVIDFFDPDYFVMGIEVNLVMANDPSGQAWQEYIELHRFVYSELKTAYPDLSISASLTGVDLLEGFTDVNRSQQTQVINDLNEFSDLFALSLYPYLSAYGTDLLPTGWLDQLFALSTKTYAFTETGYPAETFSIENPPLTFASNPGFQSDYLNELFLACQRYDAEFLINFIVQAFGMGKDLHEMALKFG